MTVAEKTELRGIQDRWLARPDVQRWFESGAGERTVIGAGGPTVAKIRKHLYPAWEEYFVTWGNE